MSGLRRPPGPFSRSQLWVAAETWISGRVQLKPKTIASYESLLRSQVLPRWETVPLVRVRNAEVVAWVASMRAQPLSAQRTRHAHYVLSRCSTLPYATAG